MRSAAAPLAALAAALAGCGGLSSPDLQTGQVAGAVTGAQPGAYAYVLGAPQLRAAIAGDGTFHIDQVPVGPAQVVVFDGDARAELVAVEVPPAARAHLERDAAAMPLASRVVPVPRPAGGASGSAAVFAVQGTELSGIPAGAGGLYPLPAGDFDVLAALTGFKAGTAPVTLPAAATVAVEVDLDVDDAAPRPGCLGLGAPACGPGLVCSGADGRCYECVSGADCGAGNYTCAGGLCSNSSPGCGAPCGGAAACGAGLACALAPGGAAGTCQAPGGCAAWIQTFGSLCRVPERGGASVCAATLAGGTCRPAPGATGDAAEVGTCTAPCASGADCPTGYTCGAAAVCVRG